MKAKQMKGFKLLEKKKYADILETDSVIRVNNVFLNISKLDPRHAKEAKNVSFYIKIDADFLTKVVEYKKNKKSADIRKDVGIYQHANIYTEIRIFNM